MSMKSYILLLATLYIFISFQSYAGDLDPTGPTSSTMHTLDEIYSQNENTLKKASHDNPAMIPATGNKNSIATGDDGDLKKGLAWPMPRFKDNGDGTIKDNLTGLVWLQNARCIKIHYIEFDNDGEPDGRVTWQHALDFVAGINSGSFPNCSGGYSDWRLPNRRELLSLYDYNNFHPSLPSNHPFIYVENYDYWTSTTVSQSTSEAWLVDFNSAGAVNASKNSRYRVWPVRGGN
jgi:hypothetical protein